MHYRYKSRIKTCLRCGNEFELIKYERTTTEHCPRCQEDNIKKIDEDPRTEDQKKADTEALSDFEKGKFLPIDPVIEQETIKYVQGMRKGNLTPEEQKRLEEIIRSAF